MTPGQFESELQHSSDGICRGCQADGKADKQLNSPRYPPHVRGTDSNLRVVSPAPPVGGYGDFGHSPTTARATRQPAVRKKRVTRPFIQRQYKLPVSQNEVRAGR